ncbi:MAG: (Fe-S)-binding protein [Nocardioides sp.]
MKPVQLVAMVISLGFTAVGLTLFIRMIAHIVSVVRGGQPAERTDNLGARVGNALKETLLHTRMLQWTKVGAAHWIIMVGFGLLFATLVNAYGQLFDAHFILPIIGHFPPFEWLTEAFATTMIWAIVPFMIFRATRPKQRVRGEAGRFYGSTMWQGYFVEWVILLVGICILLLRFFEYALISQGAESDYARPLHFPFTWFAGELFTGLSESTLSNLIWIVAMLKIVVSMIWMIVLGRNATMGVAWHRFTAPFNILFKRESSGRTALGAVKPLTSGGKAISLEDMDELDEDTALGVGRIEDFSWKARLDFTSCTECGRCQSQCPAWNTDKPLSPKLLITALRDHTYARAGGGEADRPLIADEAAYGVIDPDVLWSCTTCGACVQQCPVDIEHVDHIVDMRRYALLVESNFPAELAGLFRGLESKGNPWNMSATDRMDWAKGLDFEVPVVGEDVESLTEVDWLFWVGCAGAYEDRAKKTTRAVAELLNLAGVSFAVLGNGETCTGDPARRAGNEFVFQGLASANAETFSTYQVQKVVSTCAHCFNTLKNEYKDFGVELEVVHHTQLLNRLVREGKLTPVPDSQPRRTITYHDPCYLGRHNQVYSPPRELLAVIPGADFKEMDRNSSRSFCCGAGGARMWMEERIGERINTNRTAEAIGTGAKQIAVGCPFCRVMLSDGLTAAQAGGLAGEDVEVLDVAQMLLASVKPASAKARQAGYRQCLGRGHRSCCPRSCWPRGRHRGCRAERGAGFPGFALRRGRARRTSRTPRSTQLALRRARARGTSRTARTPCGTQLALRRPRARRTSRTACGTQLALRRARTRGTSRTRRTHSAEVTFRRFATGRVGSTRNRGGGRVRVWGDSGGAHGYRLRFAVLVVRHRRPNRPDSASRPHSARRGDRDPGGHPERRDSSGHPDGADGPRPLRQCARRVDRRADRGADRGAVRPRGGANSAWLVRRRPDRRDRHPGGAPAG